MSVTAIECVVENGQVLLPDDLRLPNHARVYVVIPDEPAAKTLRVASPRLVNPEDARDFEKEVVETTHDAAV